MTDSEEKDFHHDYFYLRALNERRKAEEKDRQKEIQESVAENEASRRDLLTEMNRFLLELAISESWWTKLREAVESMVLNRKAETIIFLLTRSEKDRNIWQVEAIVSPMKGKGTKYVKVNFGNESKEE